MRHATCDMRHALEVLRFFKDMQIKSDIEMTGFSQGFPLTPHNYVLYILRDTMLGQHA